MPLRYWKHEYSTDDKELDNSRKKLFYLLNSVYDNVISSWELKATLPLIDQLFANTEVHFSSEEQYMREHGIADIDDQISKHKVFSDTIATLKINYMNNELNVAKLQIIFLIEWFVLHVLKDDGTHSKLCTSNRMIHDKWTS